MADTTNAQTITHEFQQQVFDTVRKAQEAVVEAVKVWVDAVQPYLPPVPELPKYVATLPTPEAVVADAYDFAAQLLANQREFAQNVLKAVEPVAAKKA